MHIIRNSSFWNTSSFNFKFLNISPPSAIWSAWGANIPDEMALCPSLIKTDIGISDRREFEGRNAIAAHHGSRLQLVRATSSHCMYMTRDEHWKTSVRLSSDSQLQGYTKKNKKKCELIVLGLEPRFSESKSDVLTTRLHNRIHSWLTIYLIDT